MTRPRIGFLGVGWIGRHRMAAMLATGAVEAAAMCDASPDMLAQGLAFAPDAVAADSYDAMLAMHLDGIVIATPSALHADQAIRALEAGSAVFCQKPLGRDAAEAASVVAAARAADRLLMVDFSYRYTEGMQRIAELARGGVLGHVHAVDLVFHNAYGPDKPWFRDRALAGGGCVMDLGVHLIDLAMWTLGFPGEAAAVTARLSAHGDRLTRDAVEDHATASFDLPGGTAVRLACSWNLHAGRDAVIAATFHGTQGGAALRNVDGSFYDFTAEHHTGTTSTTLTSPPDDWGARAAADWARRIAADASFDPAADTLVMVARTIDAIYAAA